MISDDAGEWGAIEDNMTGAGILGAVVERRVDVGLSALYSWYRIFALENSIFCSNFRRKVFDSMCLMVLFWFVDEKRRHEFQFLEFSSSISRSGVTCVCPKPG